MPVSYGVTVDKSVGALLLFVLGYWALARLSRVAQRVLVTRFGIEAQLAQVIRRWLVILFTLGLVVFVLNLARIPLTVFAFLGGALAIGLTYALARPGKGMGNATLLLVFSFLVVTIGGEAYMTIVNGEIVYQAE